MAISEPTPLRADHCIDAFRCSHDSLTLWLQQRALKAEHEGTARTYVVCETEGTGLEVVGYYCLSTASVSHIDLPKNRRRNMPDPIPVTLMGRLAVHHTYERQGIGSGLLKDATQRSLAAGREIGSRGLLCHAIDESARDFYLHHGFEQSPENPLTVVLPLTPLLKAIDELSQQTTA